VICTSGNAVKIVNKAPADRPILFVPDENLGAWVMEQTGRKMDLWKGSCYVHVEFTRESIRKIKEQYPHALVVAHPECTQAVRLLAGPLSARADNADAYYALLARLPWMEAGAVLTVLALALVLWGGRTWMDRRIVAGVIAATTVLALVVGGVSPVIAGAGVIAVGLSLAPGLAARTAWGGWTGLIALVLVVATAVQTVAPEGAFLFLWTGLLAALVAVGVAFADPGLTRARSLVPLAVAVAIGGGWLMGLSHPVFLGIGMDLPGVLVVMGLLVLLLARPLGPQTGTARPLLMAALAVLVIGGALSFSARFVEPMPAAEARTPAA
jgi:hypothetical protein